MSRWLSNILLSLFSLSICFLFVEIGYRVLASAPPPQAIPTDRPEFYYAHSGTTSVHDLPRAVEKPENTFRIAVIGDSFSFPTFMQLDDAFPKRLERMLNLRDPAKDPLQVEVFNFGKRGLSTELEVNTLKQILPYKPDLVLLQITLNDTSSMDFGTAVRRSPGKYLYGNLKITPETHPIMSVWKSLGYVAQRLHASKTLPSMIRYYHDIFEEPNWSKFASSLEQMQKLTSSENVRFAAVVFPVFYTKIDAQYPFQDLHERIDGELVRQKIPFLDLRDRFAGLNPERLQVKPGEDTHPNEIAHRIAAESIYRWLSSAEMLPETLRSLRTIDREEEVAARKLKETGPIVEGPKQ